MIYSLEFTMFDYFPYPVFDRTNAIQTSCTSTNYLKRQMNNEDPVRYC